MINSADEVGNTPLHVAIDVAHDRESAELALYLAAQGARMDAENSAGLTPLAAAGGNSAMLQSAAAGEMEVDM
jgi:ankyrin repeat protein